MKINDLKLFTLSLLSATLLLSACKKDKDEKPSQATRKDLLTAKPWKLINVGISVDKDGDIEQATNEACLLDNVFTFKTDNTGIIDYGSIKCSGSEPSTETTAWHFTSDETAITSPAFKDFENSTVKIYSIDNEQMVLYQDNADLRVVMILKH